MISNADVGQILVAEMVSVVQAVIAMMRSLLGKVFAGEEEIVVETADLWEEVTGLVLPVEEATEDMVGTEDMEDETSPHEEAIAGSLLHVAGDLHRLHTVGLVRGLDNDPGHLYEDADPALPL